MSDDPPLVLVVDDEQSYRDALSVALQREGFLVETAADGPEAIARFDATRPALVLLDVMVADAGECCACDLVVPLGKSQPTISHHTKVLADAGLITGDKRGKWVWWSVDRARVRAVRDALKS